MRRGLWVAGAVLLLLTGCGGPTEPKGFTRLVLRDPAWDTVHVQVVLTKSADCDNRGPGFISSKNFLMHRDTELPIDVPDGAAACWRHDRNPNKPMPGDWSGWSRATLYPGNESKTDL
jgi:hypothetical protein